MTVNDEGRGSGRQLGAQRPAASEERRQNAAATEPGNTSLSCRILTVDDNRDAADSLAMLLVHLGADSEVAYDGPSALEMMETYRPTVVLLDIGMPGMDGYEVAEKIRANPQFDDVRIIAVTGWGLESDRQRSREAGFDSHLVKPINLDALHELLESLVAEDP